VIRYIVCAIAIAFPVVTLAAAASSPPLPAGLKLVKSGYENLFTDERGFTLYTNDRDASAGEPTCIGACAKRWPPFVAPAGATPIGSFTIVERADEIQQWAYRGKPLYTYASDPYPGAAFGKDAESVWRVAFGQISLPPDVTIVEGPFGRVLANQVGLTLYSPRRLASKGDSPCNEKCLQNWRPHPAGIMARATGLWSIVTRPDGTRQWAFDGKPLYTYVADRRPGDTLGQDAHAKDWDLALVRPPSPAPQWMTLTETDIGQVYADARGMTLYAFRGDLASIHKTTCNPECIAKYWIPVLGDQNDEPVGDWSVIENDQGAWQWAYRGQPLFTHRRDRRPGDTAGDKFAAGVAVAGAWAPVRRKVY
jgi:predicted lipoprotein with Yx(FWY)xxD motif